MKESDKIKAEIASLDESYRNSNFEYYLELALKIALMDESNGKG